jgi:hypothetical protein
MVKIVYICAFKNCISGDCFWTSFTVYVCFVFFEIARIFEVF